MALTATTLAAALDSSSLSFKATSATGATVGAPVLIGHEYMVVTAISGTVISVRSRGDQGGVAVAHLALEPVTFSAAASDFPSLGAGQTVPFPSSVPDYATIAADGAIPIPTRNTQLFVIKATACLMTLAAPSAGSDGVELTIISNSASAHTVTYSAGFYGDTTSSDVATFTAKAGASMKIVAYQGAWGVMGLSDVTLG